jgi:hypothetical protein
MFEHVAAGNDDSWQPEQFELHVADSQQLQNALAGNGLQNAHVCFFIQQVCCAWKQCHDAAIECDEIVWSESRAVLIRGDRITGDA